jgi:hypothetical protein
MSDHILRRIQHRVAQGQYALTIHADDERVADRLTRYASEMAIPGGQITERQRDHKTGDWKYIITGTATDGRAMEAVVRFAGDDWVRIITVYVL